MNGVCKQCSGPLRDTARICPSCGGVQVTAADIAGWVSDSARYFAWDGQVSLAGRDLAWSDLSAHDLSGADLTGANLEGANLHLANLSGATLRGANLSRADLLGANLARAKLHGANLTDAVLWNTNLDSVSLSEADLTGAYLRELDLRGSFLDITAGLSESFWTDVNLTGANLQGVPLARAVFVNVAFDEAIMAGADCAATRWRECSAINAEMLQVNCAGSTVSDSTFVDAQLMNAQFSGATLEGIDFTGANLKHADFSEARLSYIEFSEASMRQVKLVGAEVARSTLEAASTLAFSDLRSMILDYANRFVPAEFAARFAEAGSLEGAVLPDGTKLPGQLSVYNPPDEEWRVVLAQMK